MLLFAAFLPVFFFFYHQVVVSELSLSLCSHWRGTPVDILHFSPFLTLPEINYNHEELSEVQSRGTSQLVKTETPSGIKELLIRD